MATQSFPETSAPARRVLVLTPPFRQVRCDVARWALAQGRPCNLDAITVVLAAKAFEAQLEGRPFHRWTSSGVVTFLLGSAVEFMRQHGVSRPDSLGETLFTYLDYLSDHGELASGSSPRHELLLSVADATGLTRAGREPVRTRGGTTPDIRPLVRR